MLSNLEEVFNENKIKPNMNIYIGFAPTGTIHLGYLVPLIKVRDFLNNDHNITILLADLHATLDDRKTLPSQMKEKTLYYKNTIQSILKVLCPSKIDKVKFVNGSDFQLSSNYTFDLLQLSTDITTTQALHASSEVIRYDKKQPPKLSALIYPLMQVLDEKYTNTDAQLGGIDQRKIFALSKEINKNSSYVHFMTPLIKSLTKENVKMSASSKNKISVHDTEDEIEKTIVGAYFDIDNLKTQETEQVIKNDGLFGILNYIIFPIFETFGYDHKLYETFETFFTSTKTTLDPKIFKQTIIKYIQLLIKQIQINITNT